MERNVIAAYLALKKQMEIPVTSKSKLLKFLFNGQKDFYEEIQHHGAAVSITGWKQQTTKTYLITEKGIEQE